MNQNLRLTESELDKYQIMIQFILHIERKGNKDPEM